MIRLIRQRSFAMALTILLVLGSPILVGKVPESDAASEPMNGLVAFASSRDGNFELYVMDPDGTNEERITHNPAADLSPSWSPNGTKIAFVRGDSIHVMDADGTDVRRLTQAGLVSSDPAWSRDSKKILFSAITDGTDRDIYEIDAAGGAAKDLTGNSPSDDFEPFFTLDGNEILFTSGTSGTNHGIFAMDAAGKDRVLIFGNASSMHAQWSHTKSRIVFSSNIEKSFDIYTMNHDGSNVTRLTGGTSNETNASWSPDGTKIVFTSNRGSKLEQVHIMNFDGTNPQRLTKNQFKDLSPEIQPLASPSKEKLPIVRENGMIAFSAEGNATFAQIHAMHPNGMNVTQLGSIVGSRDSLPRWSPSGDKIAFVSALDSHEEIVVINANGTDRTTLIQSTSPFAGLGWSPNGTHLVFAKGDANHRWIFVMNADGEGVRRLTITDSMDSDPSWSPDGTRIAFTRNIDGNDEIYTMNADGTRQKRLTENTVRDHYPRWSPEAEQIAFVTNRDGNDEVYVMNPDGKSVKNLSNNTAKDHSLAWSPDGSKIIFVSDRHQDGVDIHVMDSDGKNAERLASNVGIETYPDFGSSRVPGMQTSSDESWGYELPIDTSDLLINSSPLLTNVTAGELATISTMVTNSDEKRLRIVVIMQIRDEVGITQYIDTAKGALAPKGNANFTFTWTPQVPGTFELVMFVIENSEHPNLLGLKTVGRIVVPEPQV